MIRVYLRMELRGCVLMVLRRWREAYVRTRISALVVAVLGLGFVVVVVAYRNIEIYTAGGNVGWYRNGHCIDADQRGREACEANRGLLAIYHCNGSSYRAPQRIRRSWNALGERRIHVSESIHV